jgi:hypothetical protein
VEEDFFLLPSELFLDDPLLDDPLLDEPLSADFEELSLPLDELSLPLLLEEPPLLLLSEEPPLALAALSLLLTFFLSPVLKSVSYQPLPFNLNATLETSFFNSGFSQEGHNFNRSSLSF